MSKGSDGQCRAFCCPYSSSSREARLLVGHEKRKVSSGCRVHGIEYERWRNELSLSPAALNHVNLRELNVSAVPARPGSALLYLP